MNDSLGLGGGMWMFGLILLFLIFGGNGFVGNNAALGYENLATSNEIQRGFDNQNLQAQTRDILSAVTNGTAQTISASTANATNAINAIKDGNASLIREFGNVETALTALGGKQQECCCEIKQLIQSTSAATDMQIAQSKYETSMQMAQMEARLTQKMDANEIQNLRDKVGSLELAQATNNVVRYPSNTFYSVPSPCFNCGCGM